MTARCYISTVESEKSIRGEKIATALGMEHLTCPSKFQRYTLYPLRVFFRLLLRGYSLVFVNNIPAHLVFWCWLASKVRPFFLVVDFVNLWQFAVKVKYPFLAGLVKRYENWLYKRVTAAIAINKPLADMVKSGWNVTVQEVYDAADEATFTPAFTLGNTIISAANLRRDEGVDILIRSLGILRKRGVTFSCLIAGDGDEKESLEDLVRKLSLQDSIEFLGWTPHAQIPSLYQRGSIGAIPIRAVSPIALPIKLFEQLSAGLAVVTTDTPTIRTIITHRQNGLLFPPEDVEALAQQLEALLTSPSLLTRLQRNARRTVEKEFNWKTQEGRLRDFVRELKIR